MDTTNERVHFIENMTWDELIDMENRARNTLGITKLIDDKAELQKMREGLVMEQHEHIREIADLTAENSDLKAQLLATQKEIKLFQKEIKTAKEQADAREEEVWEEILKALKAAFGEDRFYNTTPTELIIDLAEERDEWKQKAVVNFAEGTTLRDKLAEKEKELQSKILDLQDKNFAFECVGAMLKTYMDYLEALNPSQKAFENAMKKMKSKSKSNTT